MAVAKQPEIKGRNPVPPAGHDHGRCVADALGAAEQACLGAGARLTTLRRRVLELVWQGHHPVGAYEILGELDRATGATAPPTVYRALDFLMAQGLVHRIESLNAYIGCAKPGKDHGGQFLICTGCRSVAELEDHNLDRAIEHSAAGHGFKKTKQTIEISGLCADCLGANGEGGW